MGMIPLALVAAVSWLSLGQTGSAPQAPSAPSVPLASQGEHAEKPAAVALSSADDVLRALELSDQGLTTFQASVRYDQVFELQGDRQIRDGTLSFEAPSGKARRFGVRFTRFRVGDVIHDEDLSLTFDGRWLYEKSMAKKQFITREIVAEGENSDPLRLGQGPFPLPIGQKRDDILARFDVTLLGAIEELAAHETSEQAALEEFVKGCVQLKLLPKADQLASTGMKFKEIRLWYRIGDDAAGRAEAAPAKLRLLPRLARTISSEGNVSFVQLVKIRANQPLDTGALDTSVPQDDAGWDVRTEKLGG
jgi:hypothetical protein